jgi:hypothetical protein
MPGSWTAGDAVQQIPAKVTPGEYLHVAWRLLVVGERDFGGHLQLNITCKQSC